MSAETGDIEIRVSRVTVNDDTVRIVAWHAEPGTKIRKGSLLYTVETSKATFDVEADEEGVLEIMVPVGAEVEVGAPIGRLLTVAARSSAPAVAHAASSDVLTRPGAMSPSANGAAAVGSERLVSKKAQALLDEHGLTPADIPGRGLIREADVAAAVENRRARPQRSDDTAEPIALAPYSKRGLLSDARSSSGARGHGVVWLALNYVFRNWLLGNLARWSPVGLTIPIHRLRGARIGADCFIDSSAVIETAHAYNITIGDDVRIAAGAIIMTHIKAPNYLRETGLVPPVLRGVVLEDHCFIGVNAVIMPGVKVGKASVVASGAVVIADVPPFTMVAGNPAQVVKKFTLVSAAP